MNPVCPVCSVKYGKALTVGCCVCSGHVSLTFTPPTLVYDPRHDWRPSREKMEIRDEGPKIGKKEAARLEKALGKGEAPSISNRELSLPLG